jgi:hypothetical protein
MNRHPLTAAAVAIVALAIGAFGIVPVEAGAPISMTIAASRTCLQTTEASSPHQTGFTLAQVQACQAPGESINRGPRGYSLSALTASGSPKLDVATATTCRGESNTTIDYFIVEYLYGYMCWQGAGGWASSVRDQATCTFLPPGGICVAHWNGDFNPSKTQSGAWANFYNLYNGVPACVWDRIYVTPRGSVTNTIGVTYFNTCT